MAGLGRIWIVLTIDSVVATDIEQENLLSLNLESEYHPIAVIDAHGLEAFELAGKCMQSE